MGKKTSVFKGRNRAKEKKGYSKHSQESRVPVLPRMVLSASHCRLWVPLLIMPNYAHAFTTLIYFFRTSGGVILCLWMINF